MNFFFQQFYQQGGNQCIGYLQRLVERLKVGGRTAQPFSVSTEPKVRVHSFLNQIAQVFEVEGGQVARFVLNAHRAEGPIQFVQLGEAMRFG